MSAARRLIVNADDFGYTSEITRGILEAHAAGVLKSTSMLVNMAGFEDAVSGALGAGPALGVGLHLNLVQGYPVEKVPSLVNRRSGEFHPLPVLFSRVLAGRVGADEVTAECAAQIARLRDAGIAITHLDSHQHTHAMPGLWRPIMAAALAAGVEVVRWPAESLRVLPTHASAQARKIAINAAWWTARGGLEPRALALRHADHFIGVSLQGGHQVLPRLLHLLDTLKLGTTELMIHVGHPDQLLRTLDAYTWQRERELMALVSPAVRERLARGDIELAHFGVLA